MNEMKFNDYVGNYEIFWSLFLSTLLTANIMNIAYFKVHGMNITLYLCPLCFTIPIFIGMYDNYNKWAHKEAKKTIARLDEI